MPYSSSTSSRTHVVASGSGSLRVAAGLEPPPQEAMTVIKVAIASVVIPENDRVEYALMSGNGTGPQLRCGAGLLPRYGLVRALVLSLCGLLLACSSVDRPKAALKPEFASPTATTERASDVLLAPADDCRETTSLDALGFARRSASCPNAVAEASAPLSTFGSMAEYFGEPAAEDLAAAIRDRLVLQTGCLPIDERTPRGVVVEGLLAAVPDDEVRAAASAAFTSATEADGHCRAGTDQTAWVQASIRAANDFIRVGELLAGAPTSIERPPENCCDGDIVAVTSLLAMASDEIYGTLHERPDEQASEFWDSYAHMSHVRTLLGHGDNPQPDVTTIIMGSSVVARGFEASKLPGVAFNLAMVGTHQPHGAHIADTALRIHPSIDTIIWGQQSSELFTCLDLERRLYAEFVAEREQAFAPLPWVDGIPVDTLLLGRDGAGPNYRGTTLDAAAIQYYGGQTNGDLSPPGEGQSEALVAERLEISIPWWTEQKQFCQDRIGVSLDAATRWEESGRRVILVFWPLSERIRELHPEGLSIHERILADVRGQAEALGFEVLDLSTLLPDEDFYDLTHIDRSGRDTVTAALVSFLEGAQ